MDMSRFETGYDLLITSHPLAPDEGYANTYGILGGGSIGFVYPKVMQS